MTQEAAKASLSVNCRAAVSHGAMRKGMFKGVTGVVALAELGEGERWMVPPDPCDDDDMDEDNDDAPRGSRRGGGSGSGGSGGRGGGGSVGAGDDDDDDDDDDAMT
jgi:hypothetical protein